MIDRMSASRQNEARCFNENSPRPPVPGNIKQQPYIKRKNRGCRTADAYKKPYKMFYKHIYTLIKIYSISIKKNLC
jgi:hypothetical protein